MNRRYQRVKDGLAAQHFSGLLVLAVCFTLGLILGCFLASCLEPDANQQLSAYLDSYLSLIQNNNAQLPSLHSVFWEIFRWPLAVGLLGFTLLGTFMIPLTLFLRGFLLSYTVSVFLRLYGMTGLALAAAVFGFSALFSVTAIFLIGPESLGYSRSLNRETGRNGQESRSEMKKSLCIYTIVILCVSCAGAILQYWLAPALLRTVSHFLT